MDIIIKEIKAYCQDHSKIEQFLLESKALFKGEDHQVDTYFNVPEGRLKLRIGSIESNLIHYRRVEAKGMKSSEVELYQKPENPHQLKRLLSQALGVKVEVDKKRKIYFLENVKFHIDKVKNLGSFMEIEAIGSKKDSSEKELEVQCQYYIEKLGIKHEDMIDKSYSDMLI